MSGQGTQIFEDAAFTRAEYNDRSGSFTNDLFRLRTKFWHCNIVYCSISVSDRNLYYCILGDMQIRIYFSFAWPGLTDKYQSSVGYIGAERKSYIGSGFYIAIDSLRKHLRATDESDQH